MHLNKLAFVAAVPLVAGFLLAQQTRTETTTTTWNGTLLDAGCRSTRTESKQSNADGTKSQTTRTETDCPVATSTTSFGLLTPDGKFVRFDPASNTRIVEMVRNGKKWTTEINEHKPVTVHVVGKANGDVVVLETIE